MTCLIFDRPRTVLGWVLARSLSTLNFISVPPQSDESTLTKLSIDRLHNVGPKLFRDFGGSCQQIQVCSRYWSEQNTPNSDCTFSEIHDTSAQAELFVNALKAYFCITRCKSQLTHDEQVVALFELNQDGRIYLKICPESKSFSVRGLAKVGHNLDALDTLFHRIVKNPSYNREPFLL